MKVICVPDTQIKKGVPIDHLKALGAYILDHRPDVVIHLGDNYDLPALSTHNSKGHINYENARYVEDLEAGNEGLEALWAPVEAHNRMRRRNKKLMYTPRREFLIGNHEHRRRRLLDQEPVLNGALPDFPLEKLGWTRNEFLKPVVIEGVSFAHYCQSANSPRPLSRAHLIATKKHESWVTGHVQGLDIYLSPHTKADGSRVQCIVSGSFYLHNEEYKGPQTNDHWRGALMLTEVQNGTFGLVTLSIPYLLKRWL